MKGFGESSFDFEVVYYVTDPSYNLYMDIQQTINLELMTELAASGLDFAFPRRTIQMASTGDIPDETSEREAPDQRLRATYQN